MGFLFFSIEVIMAAMAILEENLIVQSFDLVFLWFPIALAPLVLSIICVVIGR